MPHSIAALFFLILTWPGLAFANPFAWTEPTPEEQLADDEMVIPLGKGAIFVPSITGPVNEPPVILVHDDKVSDLPTGSRVIVDPGSYVVIVSPGSPAQGIAQAVEVLEGETTLVPVIWGALRIQVTDERRVPHRGSYDLIRADTREPVGTGFGADTLQGENLITWLLAPGLYRLVKTGGHYRSTRNFATVFVPEGGQVRYRLVTDVETGDFLGSGTLLEDDYGAEAVSQKQWLTTLLIGADGSLVQSHNTTANNQYLLSGNLFIDGQIGYNRNNHHLTLLAQVEEGAQRIKPQNADALPILKARDRLRCDLLYTWFFRDTLGPYARAAAETRAFPTHILATEPTTFVLNNSDGTTVDVTVDANKTLRIAEPWRPTIIRQGAGMNFRAINRRWFNFNFRLGLGVREQLFGGSYLLNDNSSTTAAEYDQVDSFNEIGIESTISATARLPGWVVYSTDIELFEPFNAPTKPSAEWRNTFSLRITRNLSANYLAEIDYLPQVVDKVQLQHSVVLRATFTLL